MSAKQTIGIIEDFLGALRERNVPRATSLLQPAVTLRVAGVPAALGGRIEGRDAVASFYEGAATGGASEVRTMFGDDVHVCVVTKLSSDQFPGNDYFRPAAKPYTTWQCQVFRVADGAIAEITTYVNWADVYAQTGLIDVASLAR